MNTKSRAITINGTKNYPKATSKFSPSGLTLAIANLGHIPKTLYLLNYIDDENYRRRILTQLNRGEGHHGVARTICHGQRGEIRKRYREGQEDQLGALGLWLRMLSCSGIQFTWKRH